MISTSSTTLCQTRYERLLFYFTSGQSSIVLYVIFPQENQRILGYIYVLHRTIGSAWISGKAEFGSVGAVAVIDMIRGGRPECEC